MKIRRDQNSERRSTATADPEGRDDGTFGAFPSTDGVDGVRRLVLFRRLVLRRSGRSLVVDVEKIFCRSGLFIIVAVSQQRIYSCPRFGCVVARHFAGTDISRG